MRCQFVIVQSAIIYPPEKYLNKLLISADREWCKQDDYSCLNGLFFKETWNAGDPYQLIFYDDSLLRKEKRFMISWGVMSNEYHNYYDGRYDVDNGFFVKNQHNFVKLGYDVCTYLNASVFKFGLSPFNECFGDLSMINKFGLFEHIEDAISCADFNTEYSYDHDWYVVEIFMHKNCYDLLDT